MEEIWVRVQVIKQTFSRTSRVFIYHGDKQNMRGRTALRPVQEWGGFYCTWGREGTSGDTRCVLAVRRINKGEGIPWNEVCSKEKDLFGHMYDTTTISVMKRAASMANLS